MVSDGPSNSAWHEHRELAARMGLPLATPADLSVRGGRLHAALGGGAPRPVDVVYRRTDEDRLRDEHGPADLAARAAAARRARGHADRGQPAGSGVADDKLVHAYVEAMVRFYLDEEPLLRSVRTYDLGDPEQRSEALERLGELVVKPRDGYGGEGVVLCRPCSRRGAGARPSGWCASARTRSWPRRWSRCPPIRPSSTVGWNPVMWTCDRS